MSNGTKKEGLEDVMREKVSPLIEKSMEKNWGVIIPKVREDISDRLKENKLNILIHYGLQFDEAKKQFKKQFLQKEISRHNGNISQLAKFIGLDRRSIHRAINSLGIKVDRISMRKEKVEQENVEYINKNIKDAIEQYKGLIQEEKIEKMYQDLPELSKNIAKNIPHQELTWKQAEKVFEKEYLKHYLKKYKNVKELAAKIGLRPETVSRKLGRLKLRQINY